MGLALAQQDGCGFRYMVSTGNEAVLDVADFVAAFVDDERTKVIAAYLEGVRDGDKFRRALMAAREARKPVIVLKAGSTPASAAAAAAHTGALAGEARVWNAVLRDGAAIQAQSLEELLDVAMQLSRADLTRSCRRVAAWRPHFRRRQRRAVRRSMRPGGPPCSGPDGADARGAGGRRSAAGVDAQPCRPHAANLSRPSVAAAFSARARPHCRRSRRRDDFLPARPMAGGDAGMAEMVAAFRARCPKPVLAAWPLMIGAARDSFRSAVPHIFSEYARGVRAMGHLCVYAEALAGAARRSRSRRLRLARPGAGPPTRRRNLRTSMPRDPRAGRASGPRPASSRPPRRWPSRPPAKSASRSR